ncbi:DUF4468 domain-containing protein [Oceanihabitans sediminis]|uniref:DUF4468 domain-containing protein n=1 Tax=Oceanihabitans sediminis TaxID=1812012 RepID=UPI003A8FD2CC
MSKKVTFLLSLLIAICANNFAQENFIYNQKGLTPNYLVVEIDSLNKEQLFQKSINWIKETYKNPDEVIKTTINNEKVRFEGFESNLICVNSLGIHYCYYALYTIEIEFKDNKYKFTPLNLEYRVPASEYTPGGMKTINFSDGSAYYNKKGKLRRMYKSIPTTVEALFNDLNKSLSNYLISEQLSKESNESDDW